MQLLRTTAARRVYLGLILLLVAFLWANMVRRALQGHGSQYDDFVEFSHDLLFERLNIYREYDWARTSIGKYPPFFSLLFAPLVPLPPALGASIWFLLNLAAAAGAAYLAARTVARDWHAERRRSSLVVIPLVLAAGIVGSNLETAQVNTFIFFFLCAALFWFRQGREVAAGVSLGFITALKLTPGLFILYFIYKRAHRVALVAVLSLLVCWFVVMPIAFGLEHFGAAMAGWWDRLNPFLAEGTLAEGVAGFRHTNQSLSAALHRFLTATPAGGGRTDLYLNVATLDYAAADRIVKLSALAILGILAWLCRTPLADRGRLALAFEYSLVMIATLFISPISWINHYVVLLFPFTAALYFVRTRPAGSPERRLVLYALVASFLLVSSSALRLLQALSLPFLGALLLAISIGFALRRDLVYEGAAE